MNGMVGRSVITPMVIAILGLVWTTSGVASAAEQEYQQGTKKLYVYSVKFLCGVQASPPGPVLDIPGTQSAVQPGYYSTVVAIHNPHETDASMMWRAVLTDVEGTGQLENPRAR